MTDVAVAHWLRLAGAAVTAGLGLMALAKPDRAASFTSIRPDGAVGVSEIRATYGGFFLALGGAALAWQDPAMFTATGLAWIGAAAGRSISVVVDRSTSPKNLGAIAFEGLIGALLLAR